MVTRWIAQFSTIVGLLVGPSAAFPEGTGPNIVIGGGHACALTPAGGVKCWGENSSGQLGDGTMLAQRLGIGDVAGLDHGVVSISAGGAHTCVVTAQGGVKCWGGNSRGQLGDGTRANRYTPVDVTGLASGIANVSAGATHTCAVTTSGALKCWGGNAYGQLGDGTTNDASVPVQVVGLVSGVASVATSSENTCALGTDGSVRCWGYDGMKPVNCHETGEQVCIPDWFGQLHCEPVIRCDYGPAYRTSPGVPVPGMESGYRSIATYACGGIYSDVCGVSEQGDVKCFAITWGGQQGVHPPVPVSRFAIGCNYCCALGVDQQVYCSGDNRAGQLGTGDTTYRYPAPSVVGLPRNVVSIAARGYSTCAMTADGEGYCWGDNSFGQLGDGTTVTRLSPVSVAGLDASPWPGGLTGLWWNPAESGWGINFNHQGDILLATLFSYDASHAPLWLFMSRGDKQADGSTFAGPLYRATGPAFNAVPFTPLTAANLTTVGTMSVTFKPNSTASLTYRVDGVSVTKAIEKEVFGSRSAYCLNRAWARTALLNFQDLWWNPNESGWGINLVHQDDIIFATLFTYDAGGKALWLVMSAGLKQADDSYLGDLYQTTGPTFNAWPFTPITSENVVKIGTMKLDFSDGEHGTLTYTYKGTEITKQITRQVFSSPAPHCN